MKRGMPTHSVAGLLLLVGSVALAQQSLPISGESAAVPQQASPVVDSAPAPPSQQATGPAPQGAPAPPPKHTLGPLEISVNWRTRAEGWYWFEGATGNSEYGLWDSLLRLGIGQTGEHFDWFIEGEQPSILGLPDEAVVAAPQGQLGLGGSYYAANNNHTNVANGFVKQAFVNFKNLGPAGLKLGRFEYFDGLEVTSKDPLLATVIQTRISSRLISNFAFTAVQRSFDGVQLSANAGQNNFTFLGARPTQGVFQVKGMDELDVDTYYGAYTRSVTTAQSAGELRVFALGYIDHRTLVLKTDNRPSSVRAADLGKIEIATWGADYAHVFNTTNSGKFDFLVWGAVQTGSWGSLAQHAGAFVGEAGWQLPVKALKPWVSAGYSYGSGDGKDVYKRQIVVSADGHLIGTLPAFTAALYLHPLDEVIKLEVLRGTERKTLFIPALEMKDPMDALPDLVNSRDSLVSRLGVLALSLNDQVRSMLGTLRDPSGVVVVARVAGVMSSETGLETGDVIHSVNQVSIDSLSSLRAALTQIKAHEPIVLQVERAGGFQWLAFDME